MLHDPLESSRSKELQLNVSTGPAKALTPTPHYCMDTLTKGSKQSNCHKESSHILRMRPASTHAKTSSSVQKDMVVIKVIALLSEWTSSMLRQKYKWYFLKTELYKSKKKKQNNPAWMRSHDFGSDWIQPCLYTGPSLCLALLQATTISHQLHLNPSSLTCPNCKQRNDSLRYIEESVLFRGTVAFIQKQRKSGQMPLYWSTASRTCCDV